MRVVFFNGTLQPEDQAYLPISDRGFLYGDGIFRTLKVYEGKIFFFDEHLKKLVKDCAVLGLDPSQIQPGIVRSLVKSNEAFEGCWRLKIIISAGSRREEKLSSQAKTSLLMTLNPYSLKEKTGVFAVYPYPIEKPFSQIKSLSYLDYLAVQEFAESRCADDALILSREGYILESSKTNILAVSGGRLFFTDPSLPYMQGVMQQICLRAASALKLKIVEKRMKISELNDSFNLFSCNAMQGVLPITAIEDRIFSRNAEFEKKFQASIEAVTGYLECRQN